MQQAPSGFKHFGLTLRNAVEPALIYPFTRTATISGVHLDFLKDSKTSIPVTLPINKARLRSSVVWTGLRSIRCTKGFEPDVFLREILFG
jgi:hypothetical protein